MYPEEYKSYKIVNMISTIMRKALTKELEDWNPINEPEKLLLTMTDFKSQLLYQKDDNDDFDVYQSEEYRVIVNITEDIILPKINGCVFEWNIKEPNNMVLLMKALKGLLSEERLKTFIDGFIYPKLKYAV